MQQSQKTKAGDFRNQHHGRKLLILPNIWDALGAKIMEKAGYPSVATASVATALTHGYLDGEKIPFKELMETVKKITSAVQIPVTVDIERGYAKSLMELKENTRKLLECGGVGINIEDSLPDHSGLISTEEQCRKIEAIRETATLFDVPLVINARTDIFLLRKEIHPLEKAIERTKAYKQAGADCAYPILIDQYDDIERFVQEVDMPVNVNLLRPISDLRKLEEIGVARVSVGPQLLNHALSYLKELAEALQNYDSSAFFGRELLSREFLNELV